MFTQNIREAFRTVSFGRRLFLKLYTWVKFPFAPIYGGFPVKMISHVGKPIPYDSSLTPEQLQAKVTEACFTLQNFLIRATYIHQNCLVLFRNWARIQKLYEKLSHIF